MESRVAKAWSKWKELNGVKHLRQESFNEIEGPDISLSDSDSTDVDLRLRNMANVS